MISPQTGLAWPVQTGGYVLLTGKQAGPDPAGDDLYLTEQRSSAKGARVTYYDPLRSTPALFRVFAETEPTERGILAFANAYGRLGGRASVWLRSTSNGHDVPAEAEPLSHWRMEILLMRVSAGIYDLVRRGSKTDLVAAHRLRNEVVHKGEWPEEQLPLQRFVHMINGLDAVGDSDEVTKSYGFLKAAVDALASDEVRINMTWHQSEGRLVLGCSPRSLLGAMWLQLAQAIHNQTEFSRCPACGRWYPLDQGRGGSGKVYCSGACRSRSYYSRKVEAKKLDAMGLPLEEIAETLASSEATVARWIYHEAGTAGR